MKKSRHVIVFTTLPTRKQALSLARRLVADRLAACVQFWRIHSVYNWQGAAQAGDEFCLQCKTRASLAQAVTRHIIEHHPYSLPEVLVLPIDGGSPVYRRWLDQETKQAIVRTGNRSPGRNRSTVLRSTSSQRRSG